MGGVLAPVCSAATLKSGRNCAPGRMTSVLAPMTAFWRPGIFPSSAAALGTQRRSATIRKNTRFEGQS